MRLHLGTLLHVCALLPFTRQHKQDMGQAAVFPVVSTHIRLQLAVLSLIAFARASQVATPHVATVL